MSDGPHRTLPMRRHWKDTAERAAKLVYSPSEVREALTVALKRDLLEGPIQKVREILDARKPDLFARRQIEQLEALRGECRGSAAANVLIDCAHRSRSWRTKGTYRRSHCAAERVGRRDQERLPWNERTLPAKRNAKRDRKSQDAFRCCGRPV